MLWLGEIWVTALTKDCVADFETRIAKADWREVIMGCLD
jgi:hypothetical protein